MARAVRVVLDGLTINSKVYRSNSIIHLDGPGIPEHVRLRLEEFCNGARLGDRVAAVWDTRSMSDEELAAEKGKAVSVEDPAVEEPVAEELTPEETAIEDLTSTDPPSSTASTDSLSSTDSPSSPSSTYIPLPKRKYTKRSNATQAV